MYVNRLTQTYILHALMKFAYTPGIKFAYNSLVKMRMCKLFGIENENFTKPDAEEIAIKKKILIFTA